MASQSTSQRFNAALDVLVEQIKRDRSILAAILVGSLSHDTVWEKSDIDLVLVTIDDVKVAAGSMALNAAGVNVHAMLMPRAEFRRSVDGSMQHSFAHSFLAKGRLLYTHDETIAALCVEMHALGARDRRIQLLRAGLDALPPIYKAHKWLLTRGDLDYTALWILYAATDIARIEVIAAGQIADREVIPQAAKLNPTLFDVIYRNLLNAEKSRATVEAALQMVDDYVATRAESLFALLFDYLRDAGEARSSAEIEQHFARQFGIGNTTVAFEYLADLGLVGKVSTAARLTKKSNVDVQELAFVHLSDRARPGPEDDSDITQPEDQEWKPS